MTPTLKICGITRLEDARYAAAAGADYLGFIQYEASARYIEPARVREIVDWVYGPEPVGIFVDATADHINRVAERAGFALIQLHGDEPAFEVARIERPVIKALRISQETTPEMLRRSLGAYESVADYFLLDTHSDVYRGGTGKPFDWRVAEGLSDAADVFVAGGIDTGTVEEAVRILDPYGVDLSSSLESAPGVKDFSKIDAFLKVFEALRSNRAESNADS